MRSKSPIAELDAQNQVVNFFVYATRGHAPDYIVKPDGTKYRVVADHLGSVRLVVNASTGAVAQKMEWDTWGNLVSDTNPGFQPFGWGGSLWDADCGLHHLGAREYDPEVGRFTSKDPILFCVGLNLYGYCMNDPVNWIDPEGLFEFDWDGFKQGAMDGYVGWSNGFLNTISLGLVPNYCDMTNEGKEWGFACGIGSAAAAGGALGSAIGRAFSAAASAIPGNYRPDRALPRTPYGEPKPDSDFPHTQLGTKRGRDGDYTQAREWGNEGNGNVKPIRDIEFTDHGRPGNHPNPHQHPFVPNPTGGTPQHGPTMPFEW